MTHLSYSERIAFAQRNLVCRKRYGKPVRTLRGRHPETFISFQKKRLQYASCKVPAEDSQRADGGDQQHDIE